MRSPEPGRDRICDPERTHGGHHSERSTDQLRQLIRESRTDDAVLLANDIAANSSDPYEVARAHLLKLAALLNLGRTVECPSVVDQADAALHRHPNPALRGQFHAMAGLVSYLEGSLDRGVMHLVWSQRALETVEIHNMASADAWCDLAIVHSYLGFHDHARRAVNRAHEAASAAGVHPSEHAAPEVGIRAAVALDHRGDTERCQEQLVELLADLQRLLADAGGLSTLRPDEVPYVEYAMVRLAALGQFDAVVPLPRPPSFQQSPLLETSDLRELSAVCRAIANRRADEALAMLARISVDPRTLGGAEVHRLRALAYAAKGEHRAADEADRTAFRIASADLDRIRALFVDGIAVRLDHEELRRTVARHAGEALSDPLTGVANRRSLEQRIAQMTQDRETGVLGVVDLDSFKAVNTVHGHLTGDLVLQRVAGVLIRTLRSKDFVARYGGDEFVVIMPSTTLAEAEEVGQRLRAAITREDWESIAPGTPVSASVGWAALSDGTGLHEAFRVADRSMLDSKRHPVSTR